MQNVNPAKKEGKHINITRATDNVCLLPKCFYSMATGKSTSVYLESHTFTFDCQGTYMLILYLFIT